MPDGDVALFKAGQMHDGPFQALGRVKGKEFDGIAIGIGLIGSCRGGEPKEETIGGWGRLDSDVITRHLHERIEVGTAFSGAVAF